MDYKNLTLFGLGLLGVLLHIFVELNKLNKASKGSLNIKQYFGIEIFSICISVIVVFVAVLIKREIAQLEAVGNWLGLAFIASGYMGQSLLIFVMGKANKVIDNQEQQNNELNN